MANTTYEEVFDLALSLITSYEIDSIYTSKGTDGITTFFIPYLKSAIGELSTLGIELTVDDTTKTFSTQLSNNIALIVAKEILIGYLTKQTLDITQMRLHLQGSGDFKTYAEANNLSAKMDMLDRLKEEVAYAIKKDGYKAYTWE